MLLSWSCKICMIWIGHLIYLHPTQLSVSVCFFSHLLPFLSPPSPPSPRRSTSQSSVTSVPTPWSHTHIRRHSHTYSTVTHHTYTHTTMMCGNWRSVLRPCWGAADWSCTDLAPGPWGFVTHVCDAGLNTFPHSLSVFVSLSFCLSPVTWASSLLLCSAVALMFLHLSPSISLSIVTIAGSLRLSVLIFFQFCFLWLTVISFILCSTPSLVIPS